MNNNISKRFHKKKLKIERCCRNSELNTHLEFFEIVNKKFNKTL